MFLYSKNSKNREDVQNWSLSRRHLWCLLLLFSFVIVLCVIFQFKQTDLFKNKSFWFVISGISTGVYYGLFNDRIFQYPKEKTYQYRNELAQINSVWVHIVSGFTAGLAAYFLNESFSKSEHNVSSLGWPHLILFLVALGGYTGLLPRWIWFFASKGGPGEPSK